MELHDAIREVVASHGRSMLDDATGFRGVLDDVLEEDQATTGDINLLADAVRFGVLGPLESMIDGGADPSRAVEEAGARLARERGGDDQAASSWAAAVLGYAVGKVPASVVQRHRSHRVPTHLPPPGAAAPPAFQSGPPAPTPPAPTPPAPTPPPTPATARPTMSPPTAWPVVQPGYGSAQQPPPYAAQTSYPGPSGYPAAPGQLGGQGGGQGGGAPKKGKAAVWIAAAVAGVVLVGGGVAGVIAATGGGGDDPPKPPKTTGPEAVDLDPEAIDERYDALSSQITAGASECTAPEPGAGQSEVVECAVNAGTLRLVTYDDEQALKAARRARLDYRSGTLTANTATTALYHYDPERGGTSDPAIVYWDSSTAVQSATLTGEGSAKIDSLTTLFTATSPRVQEPTAPDNAALREFININMDVATCERQRTFFTDETEESSCGSGTEGVVVNVGRFTNRKGMTGHRDFYKGQYDDAARQGGGPTWRFGEGRAEGAYYAYLDSEGGTATIYWDWNKADCYCYGIAWSFEGDLEKLENWWPSE